MESASISDEAILNTLRDMRGQCPDKFERATYEYYVDYAVDHYELSLASYQQRSKQLGIQPGMNVLDLGCGPGHWCLALLDEGCRTSGLDKSPENVHLANVLAESLGSADRCRFDAAVAESIPHADAEFDYIVANGMFMFTEHEQAFAECNRVLKPGGQFWCGTYAGLGMRLGTGLESAYNGNTTKLNQWKLLVSQRLYDIGLGRTSMGLRVKTFVPHQLEGMAALYGFEIATRPGLSDTRGYDNTDYPVVYDVLLTKTFEMSEQRAQIIAKRNASGLSTYDFAKQMLATGAPELVKRCIAEQWFSFNPKEAEILDTLATTKIGTPSSIRKSGKPGIFGVLSRLVSTPPLPKGDRLLAHVVNLCIAKRFDEAIRSAQRLSDTDHWMEKKYLEGYCLYSIGKLDEAEKSFGEITQRNERDIHAHAGILTCRMAGDDPTGISDYADAFADLILTWPEIRELAEKLPRSM